MQTVARATVGGAGGLDMVGSGPVARGTRPPALFPRYARQRGWVERELDSAPSSAGRGSERRPLTCSKELDTGVWLSCSALK